MNYSAKLLVTVLGVVGCGVGQAAVLNAGDVLTIGAGSWFALDGDGSQSISAGEMTSIGAGTHGGVRIGETQAAGSIDTWTLFGQPGNHFTVVAPNGDTTTGINFSGWSIFHNGATLAVATDYGAWTPTNCGTLGCTGVSFTADVANIAWNGVYGASYSLWYSWSFLQAAPGVFEPTNYLLHLVGTVQAAPVPVPAAAWLLGSGMAGLIGVARRKVRRS